MVFNDLLKDIVGSIDGAIAATLMACDGVEVANYVNSDSEIDVQVVAIEYSKLLTEATELSRRLFGSNVTELTLTARDHSLLFAPLNDEYFVAILMQRTGNFGKGRYTLKTYRDRFIEQL